MDLQKRLRHLEDVHDWQGMLDELEKGLANESQPAAKAPLHLQIGDLLNHKLLQQVKALKHYQDAFKQQPSLVKALRDARQIYWQLGKLNMVQKLFDLELKASPDSDDLSRTLLQMGDVQTDEGNYEHATATYARALGASHGKSAEASACLEDAQIESGGWQDRVGELLRSAHAEEDASLKSRLFLRAARIVRRFAPDEFEALLIQSAKADPFNVQTCALLENQLAEGGRTEDLLAHQREILGAQTDSAARAAYAHAFGARWATRHQNLDAASEFLADSLEHDPGDEPAFLLLREIWGTRDGKWADLAELAGRCAAKATAPGTKAFFQAQAGLIEWQKLGEILKAREHFEKLMAVCPGHPALALFEAQIGSKLSEPPPAPAAQPQQAPQRSPEPPAVQKAEAPRISAPPARTSVSPVASAATTPVSELSPEELEERIAKLREQMAKQEAAKRFNEYVRSLVALAELVADPVEKVDLYQRAAELYVTKFANQAEAIKVYERVLELEPENEQAEQFLLQMYDKRRDWEGLIRLRRAQADRELDSTARVEQYVAIAKLATERVRKPEICTALWQEVLDSDPTNEAALDALAMLHEHARAFAELADVLERVVEITPDDKKQIAVLTKLGQIYGDRLNNDDGAVNAWRRLLALTPGDLRAKEALRKKYVALGRWDDLEVFYEESGKWDEFIRVLEQQEAKETETHAKVAMLLKIAQLYRDRKNKTDRASGCLEKVLGLEATNLAAAEALIPIYQASGNSKGLATTLAVKLEHEQDDFARLELVRELASIWENKLKDAGKAFDFYRQAFLISSGDDAGRNDMERLAKVTGRLDDAISAYREAIARAKRDSEHDLETELHLELGRLLESEAHDVDGALAEFAAVYRENHEHPEAVAALENLYRQTKRFDELLKIYEVRLETAFDFDAKRAVLSSIAKLYEVEMQQPEKAVETYAAVLEDNPADLDALRALDGLYGRMRDYVHYADILRRRVELEDSEQELIDLKYRLGTTLEQQMSDPAGAIENYREILLLDQMHTPARAALEKMLASEDWCAQAAGILDPIYEAQSNWPKLVEVLEVLAKAQADAIDKVEILRRIARVAAGHLHDASVAIDAQSRALIVDPSSESTLSELEEYASQHQAWAAIAEVFAKIAASVQDQELARNYWMRLGCIDEQIGKVAEAASAYDKVLAIDPSDAEALSALDKLYRGAERWSDLVTVYRRRIGLTTDPADVESLYSQMAEVYETKLGRPQDAIAAYREVLSSDETSQVALSALDALFTRQQMWPELAANLETQLQLALDEQSQLAIMLRLGALREQNLGQVQEAIDTYREVLDRDSSSSQAIAALEKLAGSAQYELAIADILEPLYQMNADHQKLIGVYETQVRRAEDAERKVELLSRISGLFEDAAGDLPAAMDTLIRSLTVDPANEQTQESLDRLARATSRFAVLAGAYVQQASANDDPELATKLYLTAARLYDQDLNDVDNAVVYYRKVVELDAANFEAVESLERLFRAAQRYQDLSDILQTKADIVPDAHDKKIALMQAAEIEEQLLERPQAAVAAYLKILEIDPEELQAIDSLIQRYLQLGRWDDLLGMYAKKVDLCPDSEEKKLILFEMGAVYDRELHDAPKAIDTYQRVLELDPDDLQALGRLEVLYQGAENWPELLSVLQHEADLAQQPAESVAHQYRIAELYEKRLNDVERAIELYRDILMQQPDHELTLAALELLKSGSIETLAAASVLEPIYESSGDWAKLISVLNVQVQHQQDAMTKVDILHRIAPMYEDNLHDAGSAFNTYAQALGLDNTNQDTTAALERLGALAGRWAETARLYDEQVSKLGDNPDWQVELGLRSAEIYETQLENVEGAIQRYRNVLAVQPDNTKALESLDRLLQRAERWQELAEVLKREAECFAGGETAVELEYRLGQVEHVRLGNLDAAIDAYRNVLQTDPSHSQALASLEEIFATGSKQIPAGDILEPLYEANAEWEKLATVLEARLKHIQAADERLAMFYRLAELWEERMMDSDRALGIWMRAIKEFPLDQQVNDDIERLAGAVECGWDKLGNGYADVLDAQSDPEIQRTIGKRLARVFEQELQQIDSAVATYRYVLERDASDRESLENLDRIFDGLEQWADLAGVLEQRVRATEDEAGLIELYARLGQVYEEKLSHADNAIRAYRAIFDRLEPENVDATDALARLYESKQAWTELKAVYERQLASTMSDTNEGDTLARIAHLMSDRLSDPQGAIETWKRVLDLRGEDSEALGALANLYAGLGQWAELCEVLDREYDTAETDERRVAIRVRRAKLFLEQLHREDEALEDFTRALDIDPANLQSLEAIANIWRSRKDPNELVQALLQIVERAPLEPKQLVPVHRELAATYGAVLEQPFDAAEHWNKLLDLEPGDFEALDELEKIYRNDERWSDVVGVKMARAEALAETEDKVRELLETAALWQDRLEQPQGAREAFEKILALQPEHDLAFQKLEELHKQADRSEELIELYLQRLDTRTHTRDKTDLLRRIASAFEEKLSDKNQAFDALVQAFELDVNDNDTTRQLERVAQSTNRWPELINTANGWIEQLDVNADRPRLIRLCLRLAKWYGEDLGHAQYAQPYFQKVMQLEPSNVAVLRQMGSLYRKNQQWQELGRTLTEALRHATSESDRKEIQTELAELFEKYLNEVDRAVVFYKNAIDVDEHYLPALEALERIYANRGQLRELADVLEKKVGAQQGNTDKMTATKVRVAGLYEKELNAPDKAVTAYNDALDIDPANLNAMRGLERLYTASGNWPALVKVLQQQLDVVPTERERIEILMKLASIYEEQFLKPDEAASRLEQVVEIDPTHEVALAGLERCYRKQRQWLDLVTTYERHISATLDRKAKIELYGNIAAVYATEVNDVDHAIDAYRSIVDLDDSDVPAMEALAKLYEKQGSTADAIDYMTRVADLASDTTQRVDMYYRIAHALDTQLGDRVAAREKYETALDLNPAHLDSIEALKTIALDSGEWDDACRYLDQEQMHTTNARNKAKLLVELGNLRLEKLEDREAAIAAFEQALEVDPDNDDAARPLLEDRVKAELWKEAEPLADMLIKKAPKTDRVEQHRLAKLQGQIAAALGNDEKALKAFKDAQHLDLTDQETIRGLADVSFRLGEWASALTNYQKVLTSLDEDAREERAEVYFKLGKIKRAQGQLKQAVNNFEKALAIDDSHRATLEAMVEIYAELKDWKQVCAYRRQILDNVMDGDQRFLLLSEIGDIWSERDKNAAKAIETYQEALDLKPDNHQLLHKLLALYQQTKDFDRVIETVEAIANLETDPGRKARYLFTMAQLYRDHGNVDRALELFNDALDLNPENLEAFERINRILNAERDWEQLERAFRKMIHRVAGKGKSDLEYNLLHNLGLIYRDRLKQTDSAIEAFRMAARAKPDEPIERQILAELYEGTNQLDLAIEAQQQILRQDPTQVSPYRSLCQLYDRKQAFDEKWCMCAALAFLRRADADQQAFFEQYRPKSFSQVKSPLNNELWAQHVFHRDEDLYVGKIFEMLSQAALQAKIKQLQMTKQLPVLDKRYKQDRHSTTVTFAKTFFHVANVLGVPCPELYVRPDLPGGLTAAPVIPFASVAGQGVLSGFSPHELSFVVAKHLSNYRGEHYIKNLFGTVQELTQLFFSGLRMVLPDAPVPAEAVAHVDSTAKALAPNMQPAAQEGLRLVVRKFMENKGAINIRRWVQATELTACRAGLVVCGDLDIAKKILLIDQQMPGDLSAQEKITELIVFSVSSDYFALRKALGVAIG